MDEASKKCFKCGRILPLSEFYKHSQMADGHLNKCKECTKRDVHNKYEDNRQDPSYMEKERARGRDKYKRLYGNFNPELFEARPKQRICERYMNANLARNAKRALLLRQPWLSMPPEITHVHHWSYKEPYQIFVVNRLTHYRIHHLTRYVEDKDCFVDLMTGELLDTLEKYKSWLFRHNFFYGFKDVSEPMYDSVGCNKKRPDT